MTLGPKHEQESSQASFHIFAKKVTQSIHHFSIETVAFLSKYLVALALRLAPYSFAQDVAESDADHARAPSRLIK